MAKYTENTRIQISINKCLRRVIHLKWSDKVTNITLWKWTTHRIWNKEEKFEMDRTHWGNLQKPSPITWNPPGKRWATEHLAKRHRKGNKRWDTPGKRWRGWPRTENSGVPWWMVYAPSDILPWWCSNRPIGIAALSTVVYCAQRGVVASWNIMLPT